MFTAAKKIGDEADDEIDMVKEEKKSVNELRGILAQFTDEADAELPADIPAGIRKRTCSCIADWMDESGIELLDEDEDRLEMAACKLVHHCVAVIEDEENGIRRDS